MSSELTFLCPRCIMNSVKLYQPVSLNSVEDIAFSMWDGMFNEILNNLSEIDTDLSKALDATADKNRFMCITARDIQNYLSDSVRGDTTIKGMYTLNIGWLRENAARFNLPVPPTVDDNLVIYRKWFEFSYTQVGELLVPKGIFVDDTHHSDRRCAKCGRLLPPHTGLAPEIRIALQGSMLAGKTTCIIAVIDWLRRNDPLHQYKNIERRDYNQEEKGILWTELLDFESEDAQISSDPFMKYLYTELEHYERGTMVTKTPDAQTEPSVIPVLVKHGKESFVISFVDMPGEYYDKVTNTKTARQEDILLQQYTEIFRFSDVIWTFLQYEFLEQREHSEADYRKIAAMTGAQHVQFQISSYNPFRRRLNERIERFRSLGYKMPPQAVILTKTDSIAELNPDQNLADRLRRNQIVAAIPGESTKLFQSYTPPDEAASVVALDERSIYMLNNNVRRFFFETNPLLCQLLETFSDNTRYFAMSAYGFSPDNSDVKRVPMPYNVHAPLLWSMAICGKLPIGYQAAYRKKNNTLVSTITGRNHKSIGMRYDVYPDFEATDPACHSNLLSSNSEYQDHLIYMKGGKK